jgi:hypothetical protein
MEFAGTLDFPFKESPCGDDFFPFNIFNAPIGRGPEKWPESFQKPEI